MPYLSRDLANHVTYKNFKICVKKRERNEARLITRSATPKAKRTVGMYLTKAFASDGRSSEGWLPARFGLDLREPDPVRGARGLGLLSQDLGNFIGYC